MRRGINIGSASALSSCSTRMTCPIRHGGCGLYREHEPSAVPNIFFRWDTFRNSAPLMPKKNLRDGPRRPPRRHRRHLRGISPFGEKNVFWRGGGARLDLEWSWQQTVLLTDREEQSTVERSSSVSWLASHTSRANVVARATAEAPVAMRPKQPRLE